ncbi:MAG TPA: DUF3795 domain-containing protein [Syntrophales bacterium]|nr:DUF3795 domain-containing protein [Syntrophales bacterium]
MEKMIAFCGINCAECPTFLATQEDNDRKRERVVERWYKDYHMQIKAEDINCDGCLSETGRLFSHCNVCEIRKCGQEKKVENCAHCKEYPCQKLNKFFEVVPHGKVTLDEIRRTL